MSTSILPLVVVAVFSLAKKGAHLLAAIKEKNKDKIKGELLFFIIILGLATTLIITLH